MPDEPTSERIEGPTPNGGVRSVINFLDAERKPCPKADAAYAEILEYDEADQNVGRTWLTLKAESDEAGGPPDA